MAEPDIDIRRARKEDIPELAWHMRDLDKLECYATGYKPEEALEICLRQSSSSFTGLIDGRPIAVFGCAPLTAVTGRGAPWLLTTDRVELAPYKFLEASRHMVSMIEMTYPRLENWVMDQNEPAKKWLKWLGFELGEPAPKGPLNFKFRRFTKGMN